jgi:uncharacterized protein YbjT (DUF2867 family)
MASRTVSVVTGAFGYSGRYITRRLLDAGVEVRTLTNAPASQNPFGSRVEAFPFSFDDHGRLVETLRGAAVLYNTYWVRFNNAKSTQADAVRNTHALFRAAREAGVQRVVHLSITNPSDDSPLEYFHSKAMLETALMDSGLSYAILRPTVLFGREDVLVNNIAWLLRRLPFFGVFGDGSYRLQPMYIDDMAKLAVEEGLRTKSRTINAIGPETFTYRELVEQIGCIIGKRRPIVSVSPTTGHLIGWAVGKVVGDVIITRAEIKGLMADLLVTNSEPTGQTRLTEWASANRDTLGMHYASELSRRKNRSTRT